MVAVMLAALLVIGAQAAFAVGTRVTARYDAGAETFRGTVSSNNDECVSGRTVKVFKKRANGSRVLQGKTEANGNGGWHLEVMHAHGRYIAVAPEYETMNGATCNKARSRTVDVM
jgi:hypothetical protein